MAYEYLGDRSEAGDTLSASSEESIRNVESTTPDMVCAGVNERRQAAHEVVMSEEEQVSRHKDFQNLVQSASERGATAPPSLALRLRTEFEDITGNLEIRLTGETNYIASLKKESGSQWFWNRWAANMESKITEEEKYRDQIQILLTSLQNDERNAGSDPLKQQMLLQRILCMTKEGGELSNVKPDFEKLRREYEQIGQTLNYVEQGAQMAQTALEIGAAYAGPPGLAAALLPKYIVELSTGRSTPADIAFRVIEDIVSAYIGSGKAAKQMLKLLGPLGTSIQAAMQKALTAGWSQKTVKALIMEVVEMFQDQQIQHLFVALKEGVTGQEGHYMSIGEMAVGRATGKVIGAGLKKTGVADVIGGMSRGVPAEQEMPEISMKKQIANDPALQVRRDENLNLPEVPEGRMQRVQEASRVLGGKDINEAQAQAILDAHDVPMTGVGAEGNPTYSMGDLRQKMEILTQAGLNVDEADALVRMGVAGNAPPPPPRVKALNDFQRAARETGIRNRDISPDNATFKPSLPPSPPPRRKQDAAPSSLAEDDIDIPVSRFEWQPSIAKAESGLTSAVSPGFRGALENLLAREPRRMAATDLERVVDGMKLSAQTGDEAGLQRQFNAVRDLTRNKVDIESFRAFEAFGENLRVQCANNARLNSSYTPAQTKSEPLSATQVEAPPSPIGKAEIGMETTKNPVLQQGDIQKLYNRDLSDIAKHKDDPDDPIPEWVPQQKRNPSIPTIARHIEKEQPIARGKLERTLQEIGPDPRAHRYPQPEKFTPKHGMDVWVSEGIVRVAETPSGQKIIVETIMTPGLAKIIEQDEKMKLVKYVGYREMKTIELTDEVMKNLAPVKDLQKESVERLDRTLGAGWKIRANFNVYDTNAFDLFFQQMTYLRSIGAIDDYKVFHGGDMREGNTTTIYVGDARKTKAVADYLEDLLGEMLWYPENKADNIAFGKFIVGRFNDETDESGKYQGPYSAGPNHTDPSRPAKVHRILTRWFGSFYDGAFSELPNLPSHLQQGQ